MVKPYRKTPIAPYGKARYSPSYADAVRQSRRFYRRSVASVQNFWLGILSAWFAWLVMYKYGNLEA